MKQNDNKLEKLSELRKKANYTFSDMAQKLQLCTAYYWQIEHKKRRLSYALAKKIAQIFNMKPDEIFYDDI